MGFSISLPTIGQPNSTEDVKVNNSLTAISAWGNGNIGANDLGATLAQSAAVNQGSQAVKGAVSIATTESRTNVAYGTLTTPDQITGLVLPPNGLIEVLYQATWQNSVSSAGSAAIFLNANQVQFIQGANPTAPTVQAATGNSTAATNTLLVSSAQNGLTSVSDTAGYTADVTTGQILGVSNSGGPLYIFAAAGTYTVSVQYKASSGSVTASNRKLWVQVRSFA